MIAVMPFAEMDCNAIFLLSTLTMRSKSASTRDRTSSTGKAAILLLTKTRCHTTMQRDHMRVTNDHCIGLNRRVQLLTGQGQGVDTSLYAL